MPQPGIARLKHIVVLMMENRSFDHLLGYMMAQD
jgi:phospholipase C